MTELKARHEAGREQAEREFAQRQAEAMATLYKEIQEMVKKIAQWRKMNYVVKVSNQPITGTDPNSVMAAISSTMVYADPRNDITNDVIYNLNRFYKATASPAAKRRRRRRRGAPARPAQSPSGGRKLSGPRSVEVSREIGLLEPADGRPARRGPLCAAGGRPRDGLLDARSHPTSQRSASVGGAMKGQGMLRATRPERTLARTAEVRGFGFFHGADVTLRFSPADAGHGRRLRANRPAGSTGGARPDRQGHPVPAPHHHPAGRGDRRDDRTRDGRPGRPADR